MIEAFFIRFAARLVPERFQRVVAWIIAALAFLLILLALAGTVWGGVKLWMHFHDAKVVERHEEKREAAAADAREISAEERAIDAVTNFQAEREREEAIAKAEATEAAKPPEARAVVPPTTIARRCAQLLRTYSSEQLAKMAAYQEKCR